MIRVLDVPIPKDKLALLSKEERALFLLLGYVSNQALMFQKLLAFAAQSDPEPEVEQLATGAQLQMLVRIAAGAIFEAWLVIERHFISSPLGKEYVARLDARGAAFLEALKRLFGGGTVLSAVRNNFGFHHPKPAQVEAAFQSAVTDPGLDDLWRVYFSDHSFNTLFLLSDVIFIHGIATEVGVKDLAQLQKRFMGEIREAALGVTDFAHSFWVAVWVKNFGAEIAAEATLEVNGAPALANILLPFFVETDSEKVRD